MALIADKLKAARKKSGIMKGSVYMSALVADRPFTHLNDGTAIMSKLEISGWTFLYNPTEIAMDSKMRQYLSEFRTDDGETVFVLAMHGDKLVIY